MNPILIRVLVCIAAGILYALDDSLEFGGTVERIEGLLLGWGLLPRPGDVSKTKAAVLPLGVLTLALVTGCGHGAAIKDSVAGVARGCVPEHLGAAREVAAVLADEGVITGERLSDEGRRRLAEIAELVGTATVACIVERELAADDDAGVPAAAGG